MEIDQLLESSIGFFAIHRKVAFVARSGDVIHVTISGRDYES
jgi:hypothetical protein